MFLFIDSLAKDLGYYTRHSEYESTALVYPIIMIFKSFN